MAEYLPLLERAVSGLADSTPESRRAIYERARAALIGQLRRINPPISEEDIGREGAALDEAIRQLEARLAREARVAAALAQARASRSSRVPAPTSPGQAGAVGASTPAEAARPSPASSPAPTSARLRERPALDASPSGAPPERAAPRPPAPRQPLSETGGAEPTQAGARAAPTRPVLPARPLNTASKLATEPRAGSLPRPSVPIVQVPKPAEPAVPLSTDAAATLTPVAATERQGSEPEVKPDARFVEATPRPEAPPPSRRATGLRMLGLVLFAALAAGVGYEAWLLRDTPAQVLAAAQMDGSDQNGKAVDRAALPDPEVPPQAAADAPAAPSAQTDASALAPQTPAPAPAPAVTVPDAPPASAPAVATPPSPSVAPAPAPAPAPAQSTEGPTSSLSIAERAALLVAAPEEPQKVRTYQGSVVWKTKTVSLGQGQPLTREILADVVIPEAKLVMVMTLQRNAEPQLPASHTIEFRFTEEPGSEIGSIKQIDVPLMRLDDGAPTGDPLTGLAVAITDNAFLVGLARGKAEAANVLMLQQRNWIDVPILLGSGKPAKITFEKGAPGQRILEQTIKSWQSGG